MWKTKDTVATTNKAKIFRLITLIITIIVGIVCLFGCALNNNSTGKQANPTEAVANPSEGATPTEEVTPTATPTLTLEPKTLDQVKNDIANLRISVDDLMNDDVVYPTVFGAPDENFTNEALKRIAYFESRGMDYKTAKTLIAYFNFCYLNSGEVDADTAKSYLSLIDTEDPAHLVRIFKRIIDSNVQNPKDQTVIGWGIIDQNEKNGKAVINYKQQLMTKVIINRQSLDYIFVSTEKYNVVINCKDGNSINLTGPYDDLNVAIKCLDYGISYSSIEYMNSTPGYEHSSEKVHNRLGKPYFTIYPIFNDPEHANVRRHGFDPYDYYEEDLADNAL